MAFSLMRSGSVTFTPYAHIRTRYCPVRERPLCDTRVERGELSSHRLCFVTADVEGLSVVHDVIQQFPFLESKTWTVQINHVKLLRAILLHCGVPDDDHTVVLTVLAESKVGSRVAGQGSHVKGSRARVTCQWS